MYYSWELPPPFVSCCDGDGKIRRKGFFHITLHASRDFFRHSAVNDHRWKLHYKFKTSLPVSLENFTCHLSGKRTKFSSHTRGGKKLSIPHASSGWSVGDNFSKNILLSREGSKWFATPSGAKEKQNYSQKSFQFQYVQHVFIHVSSWPDCNGIWAAKKKS